LEKTNALRGRERVFLSLGSNVGRRPDHLRRALRLIEADPSIEVAGTSFLYKTSPLGYTAQRDFLNGAVEIRTSRDPAALLNRLQEIEKKVGKSVPFPGGPRKIDIDVLFYGKRVVRRKNLIVPHPRLHGRKFVLVPLKELAPRFLHPRLGKTTARLLRECRSSETVELWGAW
jgi:2-amino-4-hydroxy-6-hydroxymethyldihydropteridine diphosphokinase